MNSIYLKVDDRVAVIDIMEYSINTYLVTRVNVPKEHRRKGIGTTMLNQLICEADKENITLLIEPRPYLDSKMSKKSLINFYEKFGFKYINENEYMIRSPDSRGRI